MTGNINVVSGFLFAHFMLGFGLDDYALGRYINEQGSVDVKVNLDGVENYDGGQRVTGLGSMFANESDRSELPAFLVENYNIPWLRAEFGKWRHVGLLKFVLEDMPSAENRVAVTSDGKIQVDYKTDSLNMLKMVLQRY